MTDRIVITISGDLPEKGKHGILDASERDADALAAQLSETHGIKLTAVTKDVRPGKKAPQSASGPANPAVAPVAAEQIAESAAAPTPELVLDASRNRAHRNAAE